MGAPLFFTFYALLALGVCGCGHAIISPMSLKDVDLASALRRLAERRIEEAMREGKFDNLPGAGKPLELEPMPADENARLMWWALRILRSHDVVPEEVKWRKRIDPLRDLIAQARDENTVRMLVEQVNDLVHKLNTLGTNVLNLGVAPLSPEAEVARFRAREPVGGNGFHLRVCENPSCRDRNPAAARYCRRCGATLVG